MYKNLTLSLCFLILTSPMPMHSMHNQSQQDSYSTGTKVVAVVMSVLGIGWQLFHEVAVKGTMAPTSSGMQVLFEDLGFEKLPWIFAKISGRKIL